MSECIVWQGMIDSKGYGFITRRRKKLFAHRLGWAEAHGPIPAGLCVLHQCDNPPCVNPAHLRLGTQADNNREMVERGRQAKGRQYPNAVLSDEIVREARRRRAAGERPYAIAREMGVHPKTLDNAVAGRSWRHVTP